jgi:hypothetical protein
VYGDPFSGPGAAVPGYDPAKAAEAISRQAGQPSNDIAAGAARAEKQIQSAFARMPAAGINLAQRVMPKAMELAWMFGVITVAFCGFKIMFGDGQKGFEELIEEFLAMGFFVAMLTQYPRIGLSLVTFFDEISAAISSDSLSPTGAIYVMVKGMLEGLWKDVGVVKILEAFFDIVILAFITLFVLLVMLIALAFLIIFLSLGSALLGIALALGPLFIACGMWSVTRGYFTKWLDFVLVAGMYAVVGKTILALMSVAPIVSPSTSSVEGALMPAIATCFTLIALAYLAAQIPDIANALMPGGIQAGKTAGGQSARGAGTMAKKFFDSRKKDKDGGGGDGAKDKA